jgi:hypothetical protein
MSKTGLDLLREPFPPHQIGKLAKGTKAQTQCPANEKKSCEVCGGWHHPKMIHLDYVGHAALTDRLLDADPAWYWEPLATKDGLPALDANGGLWIKLTVCGVTRLGYGNAPESEYKEIGSREKEVIGDALRNAAMRFGAALELWHKGDLHVTEEKEDAKAPITARGGAQERLTPDSIEQIDSLASRVLDAFEVGDENLAYKMYLEARPKLRNNADAQVAFWDKFNSVQRSALKKMLEADRAKELELVVRHKDRHGEIR